MRENLELALLHAFGNGLPPKSADEHAIPGDSGQGLQINFLGAFSVSWQGRKVNLTHQARHVLAYLAYHFPRSKDKEKLAAIFWPEKLEQNPKSAQHSLNVEISNIRKALCAVGCDELTIQLREKQYDLTLPCQFEMDTKRLWKLNCLIQQNQRDKKEVPEPWWLEVAEMSRKLFMEGFSGERYHWIGAERHKIGGICENLCELYCDKLCEEGNYDEAISLCCDILKQDPRIESIYCRLMRCYGKLGRRHKVMEQYADCCRVMEMEFDAPPSPQTTALYHSLIQAMS